MIENKERYIYIEDKKIYMHKYIQIYVNYFIGSKERKKKSTCNPSPSSIFLASVMSGILSDIASGYPRVRMTWGLLS